MISSESGKPLLTLVWKKWERFPLWECFVRSRFELACYVFSDTFWQQFPLSRTKSVDVGTTGNSQTASSSKIPDDVGSQQKSVHQIKTKPEATPNADFRSDPQISEPTDSRSSSLQLPAPFNFLQPPTDLSLAHNRQKKSNQTNISGPNFASVFEDIFGKYPTRVEKSLKKWLARKMCHRFPYNIHA